MKSRSETFALRHCRRAMRDLINRPFYLRRLEESRDSGLVKFISGIRCCGKSSILSLFHRHLTESGVPEESIVHLNLDLPRCGLVRNGQELCDLVRKRMPEKGRAYLLLDEIQWVRGWEQAVISLQGQDTDIYLTGSEALPEESAEILSGKFTEIRVLPLSFREFTDFYRSSPGETDEGRFEKYLELGGMPAALTSIRKCSMNTLMGSAALLSMRRVWMWLLRL